MLVQHLLTERLTRTIFNNPDFIHQNVIAAEIKRVITALVSQSFNREEFLKSLSRFYTAIEDAARGIEDFSEKQKFLNTVYERFFQGYSTKVADTHGIVYTPQAVVDFMSASVAHVLEREFGVALGDPMVNVLDPCTGTGNFIVNLIRRFQPQHLPDAYRDHVFANEIMLLPYYIAALNVEHAYYELTGSYEPFEGLCFVDTLDLAQAAQHRLGYLVQANTARVERQKKAEITVIIANPPYRASQKSANDENKSRKYSVVDGRIHDTFVKDSSATLSSKSYDPYLRFFRWAIDRLGTRDGIVCFITNNSFIHKRTHDGVQKHLLREFSMIYHVDLHGDRLQNPKISGTTHNTCSESRMASASPSQSVVDRAGATSTTTECPRIGDATRNSLGSTRLSLSQMWNGGSSHPPPTVIGCLQRPSQSLNVDCRSLARDDRRSCMPTASSLTCRLEPQRTGMRSFTTFAAPSCCSAYERRSTR